MSLSNPQLFSEWWVIGLMLVVCIGIYGWWIEPRQVKVRKLTVPVNPQLIMDSVTVLYISDLHVSWYSSVAIFNQIHTQLKEQPIEALLLGGDFIDSSERALPTLKKIIGELAAFHVPMYAVLGNHDYDSFERVDDLVEKLESWGVRILRNQTEIFESKAGKIAFIGIEDLESSAIYSPNRKSRSLSEYRESAARVGWLEEADTAPEKMARITLSHNPDGIYLPSKFVPNLMLSGHTHGGQIFPLRMFGKYLHRVMPRGSFVTWAGLRIMRGTTLLISRGVAGSYSPIRLGIKPEVHLITLAPDHAADHLLIGLSGKARSGKDTVAQMLQTLIPAAKRVGFSYAIKSEYDKQHGTNTLNDEVEKDRHRAGLNALGADKRAIDPNYWVKKMMELISTPTIISDVRLPQELIAVKKAGGILIRIEAHHARLTERLGSEFSHSLSHENEKFLDEHSDWDYVIYNNKSLEHLEQEVLRIYQEITSDTSSKTRL